MFETIDETGPISSKQGETNDRERRRFCPQNIQDAPNSIIQIYFDGYVSEIQEKEAEIENLGVDKLRNLPKNNLCFTDTSTQTRSDEKKNELTEQLKFLKSLYAQNFLMHCLTSTDDKQISTMVNEAVTYICADHEHLQAFTDKVARALHGLEINDPKFKRDTDREDLFDTYLLLRNQKDNGNINARLLIEHIDIASEKYNDDPMLSQLMIFITSANKEAGIFVANSDEKPRSLNNTAYKNIVNMLEIQPENAQLQIIQIAESLDGLGRGCLFAALEEEDLDKQQAYINTAHVLLNCPNKNGIPMGWKTLKHLNGAINGTIRECEDTTELVELLHDMVEKNHEASLNLLILVHKYKDAEDNASPHNGLSHH